VHEGPRMFSAGLERLSCERFALDSAAESVRSIVKNVAHVVPAYRHDDSGIATMG
jgi:hypothetical protein